MLKSLAYIIEIRDVKAARFESRARAQARLAKAKEKV